MSDLIPRHETWLRAGGRSEATINRRVRLLWHANATLPHGLDDAHPRELAEYLDDPTWSDWTRYTYDAHLRNYYSWAVDIGEHTTDPMAKLLRPPEGERLPEPCTDEELMRLLAEAPEKPWRLVILLCAYAGLRVSEAAELRRQDITAERFRIRCGKGRKAAYIETHPIIWAAVKDLPAGQVVRDRDGSPVTGYQLTNRGYYLFRKLGMPEMRIHRLRHWHASSLLAGGANLVTVQQCMRHASITSTVGYTLIQSATRRAAVHSLPLPVAPEPVTTRLGHTTEAA